MCQNDWLYSTIVFFLKIAQAKIFLAVEKIALYKKKIPKKFLPEGAFGKNMIAEAD